MRKLTITATQAKADQEEKEQLLKKQQSMFFGFVKKEPAVKKEALHVSPTKAGKDARQSDFDSTFLPFVVKARSTLAPINRFKPSTPLPEPKINSRLDLTKEEALRDMLQTVPRHRMLARNNAHPQPKLSVRETMAQIGEYVAMGAEAQYDELRRRLQSRTQVQLKHLQFHEDHRPGYVGTWTKRSKLVAPRTPFEQDRSTLNYDIDSEEEWEEDDPDAEALGGSDEEDDAGSEADSEVNSWLADDEEPLEFEEGFEGDEPMPMLLDGEEDEDEALRMARRRVEDRERKKKMVSEGAKKKLPGKLVPVSLGPHWEAELGQVSQPLFRSCRMQFLNDWHAGLDPMTHVVEEFVIPTKAAVAGANAVASTSTLPDADTPLIAATTTSLGGPKPKPRKSLDPRPPGEKRTPTAAKPLPEALWPSFVALVHGSEANGPILQDLVFKYLQARDPALKKNQVVGAFNSAASKRKGKGGVWKVSDEVLAKYAPGLVSAGPSSPVAEKGKAEKVQVAGVESSPEPEPMVVD